MMAEHRHLVEQGAQLVELRLDYINGEVNVRRLLTDRPCPVVVSCRRERDGGKYGRNEAERMMLLRSAIAEGVDYVDLEEDVAAEIPRFGSTKRIISHHDFRKTPEDLDEIYRSLAEGDADIVKICTMANHPADNFRMLQLVERAELPTVGICMGDMGVPSRILTGKFGAPLSYATFHHERALAPGQLSFDQMTEIYRYDQIDRQTKVFGVIADPIGHSLSPLIHNAAFAEAGINAVYIPLRVPREHLAAFLDDAPSIDIQGLSVTIPHKEAVLAKLTKADGSVRGIGAANTIVFRDGELLGYNTDYRGAMGALESALGGGDIAAEAIRGRQALILGAGGAGKALAYGLVRRGARVTLTDGDMARAEALAKHLDCRVIEWNLRLSLNVDFLINCTPIGMHPNVDESPYHRHHLRPAMVVFDAVYNPENTLLIKDAQARNTKVITGVEMFVRQAAIQFELFTGQKAPADLMRDVIKRATAAARY